MQQVAYHTKHTMRTFGKQMNLLACLQNGKLRRRKHTARNKAQTVFLVLFLLRNNGADCTLYKLHEPYQYQHIADIKTSMESRQLKGNGNGRVFGSHYIFHKP